MRQKFFTFLIFITATFGCNSPRHTSLSGGGSTDDSNKYTYKPTRYDKTWHENMRKSIEELRLQQEKDNEIHQMCIHRYKKIEGISWPIITGTNKCTNCVNVTVNVEYLLPNDLGDSRWLILEAFDNPLFMGLPTGRSYEPGFAADRVGNSLNTVLRVPRGEYYMRAYLTNDQEVLPYSFLGMNLVGDSPVGYLGALSTPEKFTAQYRREEPCPFPLKVHLDKLFRNPHLEPDTKARFRFKMDLAEGVSVPDYRQVIIQLHETDDFDRTPLESYSLATENFLISGRLGKAEFVTPNLEIGEYFVFSFLDINSNEYFDEGEPFASYFKNGERAAVEAIESRLANINLVLSEVPRLLE